MICFRQFISIFISLVVTTGAVEQKTQSGISSKRAIVHSTVSSARSLNTFIALDPASAPNYFMGTPTQPWPLPAPIVASSPLASAPSSMADTSTSNAWPVPPQAVTDSTSMSPSSVAESISTSNSPSLPPPADTDSPSTSPPSAAKDTITSNPRPLQPPTGIGSQSMSPSLTAAKGTPTLILPNIPNFPVTTSSLINFNFPIERTIQPTSTITPTTAPAALSEEAIEFSHPHLPTVVGSLDPLHKGSEEIHGNLNLYFETSLPNIQVNIEFSSAMAIDEEEVIGDKIHDFFLSILLSGPKSVLLVYVDLYVAVANSTPTEVVLTGNAFYERDDRPTTDDIKAQLQTYFSYWGIEHLKEYLDSDNLSTDRMWIQLNGVLVSSQASGEELNSDGKSPSSKGKDHSALSVIVSVVLIMVAIVMFTFGVFTYRHCRQAAMVQKDEVSRPQKKSRHPYPTAIVTTLSESSSSSLFKYEEAEYMNHDHDTRYKSHLYSVNDESVTVEEAYGRCSI